MDDFKADEKDDLSSKIRYIGLSSEIGTQI